jgi:hypothetical protein
MKYYVYPTGECFSTEDWTLDELITSGHSDDCYELEIPEGVDDVEQYCYDYIMRECYGN